MYYVYDFVALVLNVCNMQGRNSFNCPLGVTRLYNHLAMNSDMIKYNIDV